LLDNGWIEEAADQFQTAIKLCGGAYPRARLNLGLALARLDRFSEAREQLRRALEELPNLAACHNNLGLVDCWEGQPAVAVESFERAAALQPDVANFRFHLAFALASRDASGDLERSQAEYREGLRLDPNWP